VQSADGAHRTIVKTELYVSRFLDGKQKIMNVDNVEIRSAGR
jgi:hypothetical protein